MAQIDDTAAGLTLGNASDKVAFHGSAPVAKRVGSAQAAIGNATYAAPTAVPADSTEAASPTTAEHNAALAALASVRTQLVALAADVATHKTLANELRAALVEKGLIKGSA